MQQKYLRLQHIAAQLHRRNKGKEGVAHTRSNLQQLRDSPTLYSANAWQPDI
jgi:hypothetical protein